MKIVFIHRHFGRLCQLSSSLQRTTNACESFHSRFNQSFYKKSPSIIKWLTVLITEIQTDVYIKLKSTNISNNPQDHTVRNRLKKNEQIITDYKNGIIGRYDFVKSISYNFKKNIN